MKFRSSKIVLYLLLEGLLDFTLRRDIERIIGDNKFKITLNLDPPSNYRYKFQFSTKFPEKFKRELTLYMNQNPDRKIFYEENKGFDFIKSIKELPSHTTKLQNVFFPVTARIFFRVTKKEDPYKVVELLHREVLNASDKIPEPQLLPNSGRRYRIKFKVKKYNEFQQKFDRLKRIRENMDIFVLYEYPSWRTYLPYLGYVVIFVMSLPRINDVFIILKKFLGLT